MKKILLFTTLFVMVFSADAQKKKKGKDDDKKKKETTDYQQPEAVADTATKFTGLIKYMMTSDDPSQKDSMFIAFGEDKIRITMFYPGYKAEDIFQDNFIANFSDSTFLVLDNRKKTYKTEKLGTRNPEAEMTLMNYRKLGQVMKIPCKEFSGEMKLGEDVFEAAALVSNQYSFIKVEDYNFMNIHAVVLGYKIALGWRTKTPDNENTFILAYKIEPGDPSTYFDLTGYKAL